MAVIRIYILCLLVASSGRCVSLNYFLSFLLLLHSPSIFVKKLACPSTVPLCTVRLDECVAMHSDGQVAADALVLVQYS